jgi:hypothetical protein
MDLDKDGEDNPKQGQVEECDCSPLLHQELQRKSQESHYYYHYYYSHYWDSELT